jgi:outer membrane protein assembly factor BamB
MAILTRWLVVLVLLASCVARPAAAAERSASAPLGSASLTPSPERPVGWRGDGTGHFPGATPPISWERKRSGAGYATKGILWAAQLPNGGISSPIVVDQRVFVTTEVSDLVCLDKPSGRILWIRSNMEFEALGKDERKANPAFEKVGQLVQQLAKADVEAVGVLNAQLATAAASEYRLPPALVQKRAIEKQIQEQMNAIDKKRFDHSWPQGVYGYCTETPTSDGKHVCAMFATGVAACYDLEGNRKWIARGSNGGEEKGHYTSPLLLGNQLVVWGEPEMRSYDVETGKVLWRNAVQGTNTQSLFRLQVGDDLVAGLGTYFVRARDGKTLWGSKMTAATPTPIVAGGMIYSWAGNPNGLRASRIPAGIDSGKVVPRNAPFKIDWGSDLQAGKFDREIIASPLFVDGLIYEISCGGGLLVNDAADGSLVYRKILPMKPHTEYWAWGGACVSPALAGKNIYLTDNQGTTVIIQPGRQYKEVAVNRIEESLDGKSQDQNLACPFFDGTCMYHRTPGYLYCTGEKGSQQRLLAAEKAEKQRQLAGEKAKQDRQVATENAKWRTWTDATGEHQTKAKFSGVISGKVKLLKADGTTLEVPLEKLSDEDRQWIASRKKP